MKFQTADMAAKRLNVTVRAVQKWAKEGKIDNAQVSMWTMFLILSAAGFVAINIFGKRKEIEE